MRRVRYFLMGVALGATACLLLAALAGCQMMDGLRKDIHQLTAPPQEQKGTRDESRSCA